MGFGDPTKYLQLEISKVPGGVTAWDRAVQDASEEYKSHMVQYDHTPSVSDILSPLLF